MDLLDVGAAEFIEPSHFTCLVTIVWQPLAMTQRANGGAPWSHPSTQASGRYAAWSRGISRRLLRQVVKCYLPCSSARRGGLAIRSSCGGAPQAVSHDGLCRHQFFWVDNG